MVLMFSECERQRCLNVTVTQDLVKEPDEIFTVHMNRTIDLSPRIDLDPVDERIEIVDDDSEQFMYGSFWLLYFPYHCCRYHNCGV